MEKKMPRHIHAEEIHAWAEGYTIQHKVGLCCESIHERKWEDIDVTPGWYPDREYRVKPNSPEEPAL